MIEKGTASKKGREGFPYTPSTRLAPVNKKIVVFLCCMALLPCMDSADQDEDSVSRVYSPPDYTGNYPTRPPTASLLLQQGDYIRGQEEVIDSRALRTGGQSDGVWGISTIDHVEGDDHHDEISLMDKATTTAIGDEKFGKEIDEEDTAALHGPTASNEQAQSENTQYIRKAAEDVGTEGYTSHDSGEKSREISLSISGVPGVVERETLRGKVKTYTAVYKKLLTSHMDGRNHSVGSGPDGNITSRIPVVDRAITTVSTGPGKVLSILHTNLTQITGGTRLAMGDIPMIPNSTQVAITTNGNPSFGMTNTSEVHFAERETNDARNITELELGTTVEYSPIIHKNLSVVDSHSTIPSSLLEPDGNSTKVDPSLVSEPAESPQSVSPREAESIATFDLGLLHLTTSFQVLRDVNILPATDQSCFNCNATWRAGDKQTELDPTLAPSMITEGFYDESELPGLTPIHVLLLFVAVIGAGFLMFTNLVGVCCCQNYFKTHGGGPVSDVLYRPVNFSQRRYFARRSSSRERNRDSMIRRIADERLHHFSSVRGSVSRDETTRGGHVNDDVVRGSSHTVVNMELLETPRHQGSHWINTGNRQSSSVFYS